MDIFKNSVDNDFYKEKVRTSYLHGDFTDFTGQSRSYCLAAVSTTITDRTNKSHKIKIINIGLSVQSPHDLNEHDEKLAETIAYGKALKDKTKLSNIVLYNNDANIFGRYIIDAILGQEADRFEDNPGMYIKGYESDKKLYEASPKEYFAKYEING